MKTLMQLRHKAKELWPTSSYMRRQWMIQTAELYAKGRHALQTGGYSINQGGKS